MTELLKTLCELDGVSGDETAVSDYIISQIDGFCEWERDGLGNIIVRKKGKNRPAKKVMLDAHTDEVGLIVTGITPDGFLKFETVGGIETPALMFKRVKFKNGIIGAVSGKPVHLISKEQREKLPKISELYIDIGAESREDALSLVNLGDTAVICGGFLQNGGSILSKAIDDRAGCVILIDIIKNYSEYDFCASFSVQEEVGLRGAKVSAYTLEPDCAIVLESTTASDVPSVASEKTVCDVGKGPAVSFMDRATLYDKEFYRSALESKINCQPKRAVTGGNNSGSIHLSRSGVRTVAVSVPCRYIHSPSSVADISDIENAEKLALYLLDGISSGEIK